MTMFSSWPIPNWQEAPSLWDACRLDGLLLPGVWTCNIECKRELDVKKAASFDGAHYKDKGYTPAEVMLSGRFLPEDFITWQDCVRALHPQTFGKERKRQRKELRLDHPNAHLMGVTRVYLVSIQAPTFDNGLAEVAIELLQAVKPAPVKAKKATAAETSGPEPLQGTALDLSMPYDLEVTY
jgi:hypothetical protein